MDEGRISVDFRRNDLRLVVVSLGIGLEFERIRRRGAGLRRSFFTSKG